MIKPAGHRILVRPDVLEEVDKVYAAAKKAGIELLKDHEDRRREQASVDKGTVIGVGESAFKDFNTAPWCAVGDRVAFAKFAGKYIEDEEDGVAYLILNDEDIVAVFSKGEA